MKGIGMECKHPELVVEFESSGESGNAFRVIALVTKKLEIAGFGEDAKYIKENFMNQKSYDALLGMCREFVNLVDIDGNH